MNERIREKLAALKAMAERGTEHEAAIAASKLSQLCAQYGIEMGSVEDKNPFVHFVFMKEKSVPKWKLVVASAVSNSTGAFCWRQRQGDLTSLNVVGIQFQIDVIKLQYEYLCEAIERLSETQKGRSAKNAFRLGAAKSISCKLSKADEGWESEHAREEGLLFLGSSIEKAKEHVTSGVCQGLKVSTMRVSNGSDRQAFAAGYRAGNNINLSRQVSTGHRLPAGK